MSDEINDEVRRGPGRPPATPPGLKTEDVLRMLAEMQQASDERMMKAIEAIRKPSELEQRKLDKELALDARKLAEKKANAIAMVQAREQRMRGCTHTTYHPLTKMANHTWRGQWHTPPDQKAYFVPTCTQCQTQLPKIYSMTGDVSHAVDLHEVANVDIDRLLGDAIKSGNGEEVTRFKSEHHFVV